MTSTARLLLAAFALATAAACSRTPTAVHERLPAAGIHADEDNPPPPPPPSDTTKDGGGYAGSGN